jgi:hypothetical protein
MELVELGQVELTYRTLGSLDFGVDGQLYGTLEGTLVGDRLSGTIELTNLAPRRADNVNLPTLRGVLTTSDSASIWLELDGIATLRELDDARVFVTSFRMRCGDARYGWVNTVWATLEGVLDSVGVGGVARGRVFECLPTIS